MRFCVMEETPGMGGIKSILEATPGYFKFHLFDRGYKSFQVFFKVVTFFAKLTFLRKIISKKFFNYENIKCLFFRLMEWIFLGM